VSVAERPAGRLARALGRVRSFSPEGFRVAAFVALGSLFVVVVTGAIVRLTASGLGCENWPRCGDTPFPEQEFHALVEFGNRVVAVGALFCTLAAALVARRVAGLPRYLRVGAALVAASVLAQIPLGGLTVVFELHPLLVMSHFLLALAAVGLAVVVALGADRYARGASSRPVSLWVRRLALALVPVALVVVVTGAFATAAGPHSGGAEIERLGVLVDSVYVHVRATAAFGIGFLVLVAALWWSRSVARTELKLALGVLGLILIQMAVGEIQWRNALPWGLVLVHVALATAVWAGIVAIAAQLLARPRIERATSVTHTRVSSS
jgi:cytochrome c oxidase assembly protein subunit 15